MAGPAPDARRPVVRVVVLNFDGGPMTLHCLDSLLAADPAGCDVEVVLVDNASVDGVTDLVRAGYPGVKVIESLENTGFAGGCNLGMGDLTGVDFVALVNNDAMVDAGWLGPLRQALEADPGLGAACPKMLFATADQWVRIEAPTRRVPPDTRELGVKVDSVRLDGRDVWDELVTDEGVWWPEPGDRGEPPFRWTKAAGELRFPLPAGATPAATVEFRLTSPTPVTAVVSTGVTSQDLAVGPAGVTVTLPLDPTPAPIINNAGSALYVGGYGGDRGFLERDTGQYDDPAEVFAWCGGAVLLRAGYLADVGRFDERLFLYYEDTDLSWRGRWLGWRYRYVPGSVVRHRHAQSSGGPRSEVFRYHVERNRLLVLAKCAPRAVALAAWGEQTRHVWGTFVGEVLRPLPRRPRPVFLGQRWRSLHHALRLLPGVLRDRRALRAARRPGAWTDASYAEWVLAK